MGQKNDKLLIAINLVQSQLEFTSIRKTNIITYNICFSSGLTWPPKKKKKKIVHHILPQETTKDKIQKVSSPFPDGSGIVGFHR